MINRKLRALYLTLCVALTLAGLVATSDWTVSAAPLTTQDLTQGKTAQQLASALAGGGVTISNVAYKGAMTAAGSFSAGGDVVGFESGIVLSTGHARDVIADSGGAKFASTNLNTPGDANLNALITGATTNDAAVLEFDFVPESNQVFFEFVFASEEYNEYVDSKYNDVFGFFVNGTNCAKVNGQPISINTVNKGKTGTAAGVNGQYFIKNDTASSPRRTSMDGLTTVLVCQAAVNGGSTNRLKLAIADTGDRIYDAAVFIKAGSISTTLPPGARCANFADVAASHPACPAITALSAQGVIKGYATNPPTFGPTDDVQRAQVAAFLVRALGWQGKPTGPKSFNDFGTLVAELRTASLILANQCDANGLCVARGYDAAACTAKGLAAPCFAATERVTHAQVVTFIARAFQFDATEAWQPQPNGALPYTGVPTVHQPDVRTYHKYAGTIPEAPTTDAGWNQPASRAWIARVLYQALQATP